MHRFQVARTLHTTTLGATYECSFLAPHEATHRPSSLVLKRSSLALRKQYFDTFGNTAAEALDDPLRERAIVARLIASGGHDHVVQCYDQFVSRDEVTGDECVCLVMEYCDGGDLCSLVTASPLGVGEARAVCLMLQVASGVWFLQSRLGLAHRDLSLENVFVRNGVCKLGDFGLETPLNEKCYGRVGKPMYMAPEVVASSPEGYDPAAADVWSLGVMLFILLTGSPLVGEATPTDSRFVVLTEQGVGAFLWSLGLGVSQGTMKLLDGMLHMDPVLRPSIADVRRALDIVANTTHERETRRTP